MPFFTIYDEPLRKNPYQQFIESQILSPEIIKSWANHDYQKMLQLKNEIDVAARSFYQLTSFYGKTSIEGLPELESTLAQAIREITAGESGFSALSSETKNKLNNYCSLLKYQLSARVFFDKLYALYNITLHAVVGFLIFAYAPSFIEGVLQLYDLELLIMATCAILAILIVDTQSLLTFTDIRFLFDRQFIDINRVVSTVLQIDCQESLRSTSATLNSKGVKLSQLKDSLFKESVLDDSKQTSSGFLVSF